jgi:type II secretory pathway component PulM
MRSSIAYTGLFRNSEAGKAIDLSQHRGVAESLQSLTPAEKRLLMVMVFILVMLLMALIYLYFVALF